MYLAYADALVIISKWRVDDEIQPALMATQIIHCHSPSSSSLSPLTSGLGRGARARKFELR